MSRTLLPALSLLLAAVSGSAAPKADFFVAPAGRDTWSGKLAAPNAARSDGPFATVAHARDAVRALKAREPARPINVLLRGGTHYLGEVLTFGPDDSGSPAAPITYAAYPGETPVLSAGVRLRDFRPAGDHIFACDVPGARNGNWDLRQLRVGDERQIRARTPSFDPANPYAGGWLFARKPPGMPGGGFGGCVGSIHNVGDYLEYDIDVPADGDYRFMMYYGAQNAPFGRDKMDGRTSISVDGAAPVTLVNLPDTGGWFVFKWSDACATFHLTAGKHHLRWRNDQGGGLNLDAYLLVDDPDYKPAGPPPQPPAPGKHLLLVQWEAFTRAFGPEMTVSDAPPPEFRDRLYFDAGAVRDWDGLDNAEVYVFSSYGWVSQRVGLGRVDEAARCLYFDKPALEGIRAGNRFLVENLRFALDSPGEWFYDRKAGRILYWPRSADFARQEVVVSVLDRVIHIKGDLKAGAPVHDLVFRGLTIKDASYNGRIANVYYPDDGAIWLDGAESCTLLDCRFICVGGYAVRLGLGAHRNRVLGCTADRPGEGFVLIMGDQDLDPASPLQPSDNTISGCRAHHCGCHYAHVAGVYMRTARANIVSHNEFSYMPRYGISWKSGAADNIVEYNDIDHVCLETHDTGGIECWMSGRGNIIRNNRIRDIVGLITTPDGKINIPWGTIGIYLDDMSSGEIVENNIVARTVYGGMCVHGGGDNLIRNNIFVGGTESAIFYPNYGDGDKNNLLSRNIFYWTEPKARAVWAGGFGNWRIYKEHDYNVYWPAGLAAQSTNHQPDPAKMIFVLGGQLDWNAWRAKGYDEHSVLADPLFVDVAHDDFTLRPESPALKLGFKQIDLSRLGLRGYRPP
jgi:parallel beta-helix repeat protein